MITRGNFKCTGCLILIHCTILGTHLDETQYHVHSKSLPPPPPQPPHVLKVILIWLMSP